MVVKIPMTFIRCLAGLKGIVKLKQDQSPVYGARRSGGRQSGELVISETELSNRKGKKVRFQASRLNRAFTECLVLAFPEQHALKLLRHMIEDRL
jgi:hypothetical protein